MSDLITDAMVEAAADALVAHGKLAHPCEGGERTCAECGYAFGWAAGSGAVEAQRYVEHRVRAALEAAAPLIAAKVLNEAADETALRGESLAVAPKPRGESIDAAHIDRQRGWSAATFGPGPRLNAILDHIGKEMREIAAQPLDLAEWVDVIILALDGAWRAGWESQQIIDAIREKQARNEARSWPDWRTSDPDRAIEHIREAKP